MPRNVLHLIGHAHLDPVWAWRWREGAAEALTTLHSACDRLDETPDMCFSCSSAQLYRWIERQDGRLFRRIRRFVQAGRWEVLGGWVTEPDNNIPATESFARQALLGQTYFHERLGTRATVGFCPDTFGHAGGLPQLLVGAGLRYYTFMRPQEHEANLPRLFWWAGDDEDSRVLTWRIAGHYGQTPVEGPDELEAQLRRAGETFFQPGLSHAPFFLGVGNHGGGPTRRLLARLIQLQGDPSLPELRFSTLGAFFSAVEAEVAPAELPVVRGDLQYHARGCYSACGQIKADHRRAEVACTRAETLAAVSELTAGERRELTRQLADAWWQVTANEFHDILAGTSVPSAYVDARDQLGRACSAGDEWTVRLVHRLARRVDTSGMGGAVLFAFNPLPWRRRCVVEVDMARRPVDGDQITHLVDAQGRAMAIQWTPPEAVFEPSPLGWGRLTAQVELPGCGWSALSMASGEPETPLESASLDDSPLPPWEVVVLADRGDTWAHGVDRFDEVLGVIDFTESAVVADGAVVRHVRHRGRWQDLPVILDERRWAGQAGVELTLSATWQRQREILALRTPTGLADPRATALVAGGVADKPTTGEEFPAQRAACVTGQDQAGQTRTVALLAETSYSYCCNGDALRVIALRSTPYAEHDPSRTPFDDPRPMTDQGWQQRRYWLIAGDGEPADLRLPRRATDRFAPAEHMIDSAHPGDLRPTGSLLSVEPESVHVLACKPADDGEGAILRLQETAGQKTTARVAITLDALRSAAPAEITLSPGEIKTYRLRPTDTEIQARRTDLLEDPLN